MNPKLALWWAFAIGAVACQESTPKQRRICTIAGATPEATESLGCSRDFELLADSRDDAVFAHTASLNVVLDREDGQRLYFTDTGRYLLHFDFAREQLEREGLTPVGTHAEFNLLNYRRDNRRFMLGKLIRYEDLDLLTLEISAGDTAGVDMIVDLFDRVQAAIYDGEELHYRPVSGDQERLLPELPERILTVRADDIFQGQHYQPLNQGLGYGTLRFRRASQVVSQPLLPTDIVVLDRVPNDISVVSGIITGEFQTPLSHVNVLARGRGTPNMALRSGFDDPTLRSLEGELVRLEVGPQDFVVEPVDSQVARVWWDSLRPSEPLVPVADLAVDEPVDLAEATIDDTASVGAKAAGFAELGRIEGVPVPSPAFALPFSWYARHFGASGVAARVQDVVESYASGEVAGADLERALFQIRWAIFQTSMDPVDRDLLVERVTELFGDEKVRFRSSTNVEDLAEFSGAGLYTSAGATVTDGAEAVEAAVKTVWASVWNLAAFVERDFYRVDHSEVQMGVLVHRSFQNERANGVAITINEFAARRPAYYINAQIDEVAVANPTGLATPEQLLYYTWYEEPEYEVLGRSNINGGAPILDDAQLGELGDALGATHQHFRDLHDPEHAQRDFAVDVEFKIDSENRLFLKQARLLKRRGE